MRYFVTPSLAAQALLDYVWLEFKIKFSNYPANKNNSKSE